MTDSAKMKKSQQIAFNISWNNYFLPLSFESEKIQVDFKSLLIFFITCCVSLNQLNTHKPTSNLIKLAWLSSMRNGIAGVGVKHVEEVGCCRLGAHKSQLKCKEIRQLLQDISCSKMRKMSLSFLYKRWMWTRPAFVSWAQTWSVCVCDGWESSSL